MILQELQKFRPTGFTDKQRSTELRCFVIKENEMPLFKFQDVLADLDPRLQHLYILLIPR